MTNSCNKGKRGEREWRDQLIAAGFDAKRGQQHEGGSDSPDVICPDMPGFHAEVKRVEMLQLYPALDQAQNDAASSDIAYVAHRRNGKQWCVILSADDFLLLASTYLASKAESLRMQAELAKPTGGYHCPGMTDEDRAKLQAALDQSGPAHNS